MSAIAVKCGCCGDDISTESATGLNYDPVLGHVCDECAYRMRVASAHMIANNMGPCETTDREVKK